MSRIESQVDGDRVPGSAADQPGCVATVKWYAQLRDLINRLARRRSSGRRTQRMAESVMYHEGNRLLQDQFDRRRISDRMEQKLMGKEFTADDK